MDHGAQPRDAHRSKGQQVAHEKKAGPIINYNTMISKDEFEEYKEYVSEKVKEAAKKAETKIVFDTNVSSGYSIATSNPSAGDVYYSTTDNSFYTPPNYEYQKHYIKPTEWTTTYDYTIGDPWEAWPTDNDEDLPLEMLDREEELEETLEVLKAKALQNPALAETLEQLATEDADLENLL